MFKKICRHYTSTTKNPLQKPLPSAIFLLKSQTNKLPKQTNSTLFSTQATWKARGRTVHFPAKFSCRKAHQSPCSSCQDHGAPQLFKSLKPQWGPPPQSLYFNKNLALLPNVLMPLLPVLIPAQKPMKYLFPVAFSPKSPLYFPATRFRLLLPQLLNLSLNALCANPYVPSNYINLNTHTHSRKCVRELLTCS